LTERVLSWLHDSPSAQSYLGLQLVRDPLSCSLDGRPGRLLSTATVRVEVADEPAALAAALEDRSHDLPPARRATLDVRTQVLRSVADAARPVVNARDLAAVGQFPELARGNPQDPRSLT
jgi:hypothetical protein